MRGAVVRRVSIVHSNSGISTSVSNKIVEFLENNGIKISNIVNISELYPDEVIELSSISDYRFDIKGDIMIVVGGDGTVLKALLGIVDKETPVLSVGVGEKNFIASTTLNNLKRDMERFIENKFYIRREMRLVIKIEDIQSPPILNEVSYHSAKIGKTIQPIVAVKDERGRLNLLWSVKSDGVLVATPIGSTAYSYSAGGPVLDTNLEAIVITPLIPTSKIPPYVVNPNYIVSLKADRSRSNPRVILDGQISFELDWDTPVDVYKSDNYALFIVFDKSHNISRMVKVAGATNEK